MVFNTRLVIFFCLLFITHSVTLYLTKSIFQPLFFCYTNKLCKIIAHFINNIQFNILIIYVSFKAFHLRTTI